MCPLLFSYSLITVFLLGLLILKLFVVMALPQPFYDVLGNPAILDVCTAMGMFFSPLWAAFFFGVVVGWLWKPKWASLGKEKLATSLAKSLDFASPSSASPSNSRFSPIKAYSSSPCLKSITMQSPNPESLTLNKKASSDGSTRYFLNLSTS